MLKKVIIFLSLLLISIVVFLTVFTSCRVHDLNMLNQSIEEENYEDFQYYLKRVGNLDAIPKSFFLARLSEWTYMTPLQTACKVGNDQMVQDLVQAGANVNFIIEDIAPFSPLMCAATSSSEENLKIVNYLIQQGADVRYRKKQYDADVLYQVAISKEIPNNLEIFDLLIDHGANVAYSHKSYSTLLNIAAFHGNDSLILHLIAKYRIDPNCISQSGYTALIYYCRSSAPDSEIVRNLLESGADPSYIDPDGKTAYDHAIERGHFEIATVLGEHR
ncbi:MAG: hypothetical protein E7666_06345 [Ruminococcaceae bacterium]|nr:hypothetical protein [Oscillospiraceae bacterium]